MIIYYHKITGEIVGSVGGRVHQPEELKMWIGSPKEVDRIVVEWKPVRWYTKEGHKLSEECLNACDENGTLLLHTSDFEPNCSDKQKSLFEQIEKTPMILHEKYKVDIVSKKLKEKTKQELDKENKVKEEAKKRGIARKEDRKRLADIVLDNRNSPEIRLDALLEILNFASRFEKINKK